MTVATGTSDDQVAEWHATVSQDDEHVEGPENEYNDPLDDVFGSAPPSPSLDNAIREASQSVQTPIPPAEPSDIPRLRSRHVTAGYREGIAASKDQHIQAGFDEGYSLGAEIGSRIGWCLGALEGICKALAIGNASSEKKDEARRLWKAAEQDLSVDKVFGQEYFGEDGVWLFEVSGKINEDDVSFVEVASAHPLVGKWTVAVRELMEEVGLNVDTNVT